MFFFTNHRITRITYKHLKVHKPKYDDDDDDSLWLPMIASTGLAIDLLTHVLAVVRASVLYAC
jgi:hypothetical protein